MLPHEKGQEKLDAGGEISNHSDAKEFMSNRVGRRAEDGFQKDRNAARVTGRVACCGGGNRRQLCGCIRHLMDSGSLRSKTCM